MIVLDSSAAVDLLLGFEPRASWVAELVGNDPDVHAPHVIDVEVAAAIRRAVLADQLAARAGRDALDDLAVLVVARYSHVGLLDRMWELRSNVTAADAAFVALAEVLDVPLVTTDAGMAGAPHVRAAIIAFET